MENPIAALQPGRANSKLATHDKPSAAKAKPAAQRKPKPDTSHPTEHPLTPPPKPAAAAADGSKTHRLSLKGSARLVADFFQFSIHTILFQRGVYPAEDFAAVKKYGLNMLVSADDQVKAYIRRIMGQLDRWMVGGKISRLVVVITDKDTAETVERWQFDVHISSTDADRKRAKRAKSAAAAAAATAADDAENASAANINNNNDAAAAAPPEKTEKEIQDDIAALFRQITASVTFLPQLQGDCTFNVLVYADADSDVPVEWADSDAKEIEGGEKVQLRGFSTSSHRVDTMVSYRSG